MLSLAAMRVWRLSRVTMLIQYLYRDEVALGRFQTGLVFADNVRKPSLQGFKLPFAEMRRDAFSGQCSGARSAADGPGVSPTGSRCFTGTSGKRSGATG